MLVLPAFEQPSLFPVHSQSALSLSVSPEAEDTSKRNLHRGGKGYRLETKSRPLVSGFLYQFGAQKAPERGMGGCHAFCLPRGRQAGQGRWRVLWERRSGHEGLL